MLLFINPSERYPLIKKKSTNFWCPGNIFFSLPSSSLCCFIFSYFSLFGIIFFLGLFCFLSFPLSFLPLIFQKLSLLQDSAFRHISLLEWEFLTFRSLKPYNLWNHFESKQTVWCYSLPGQGIVWSPKTKLLSLTFFFLIFWKSDLLQDSVLRHIRHISLLE